MTDQNMTVDPARTGYVLIAYTYLYMANVYHPTSGYIKTCLNGRCMPTHDVKVDKPNSNLYNGTNLKHRNIAHCTVHQRYNTDILALEPFFGELKLKTYGELWRLNASGHVIGATPLLKGVVKGVINALKFLQARNLSHGKTWCIDSVVFDASGNAMLTDFSSSSKNSFHGLFFDVRGLGELIGGLIPFEKYDTAALEVKSMINMLKEYKPLVDLDILKRHPALLSPEKRRNEIDKAHRLMQGDLTIRNEFKSLMEGGNHLTFNLCCWKCFAEMSHDKKIRKTVARVLSSGEPEYKDKSPHLMKFERDFYTHCNDLKKQKSQKPKPPYKNSKQFIYTDQYLEDIFKDMYPNLLIEWYFFHNRLRPKNPGGLRREMKVYEIGVG